MDQKGFQKLVDKAKGDPAFFHALAFEPEKVLSQLDFLGRQGKGAVIAQGGAELLARLIGVVAACGNTCSSSCDNTCGGSCGYTTNLTGRGEELAVSYFGRLAGELGYCGNTCSSSCDNTCGGSCGYTTNLTGRFGSWGSFR